MSPRTCFRKWPLHMTFSAVLLAIALLTFLSYKQVTMQQLVRLSPLGQQRVPDVVIVGARKCGTRALLEMMSLHPHIVSARGEVHFYDRFFSHGVDWYRHRMPVAAPGQLILEKTPAYFVTPLAPERMAGVNPDTLVVLVVRDPVSRLVSDFSQLQGKRSGGFDQFVLSPNGEVRSSTPVSTGLYARHFLAWAHVFPPNQIHVVDGDQLVRDPAAELTPLWGFLGLAQLIGQQTFYFNASKGFFCWHTGGSYQCLGGSKGRDHPDVSANTLKRLRAFYKDANAEFFRALRALNKTAAFDWNHNDLF